MPVQDPTIRCPNFYGAIPTTMADGGIFEFDDLLVQALRVATEDFFGGSRPLGRPCSADKSAYSYRVVRRGDLVFVKIVGEPQRCGLNVISHAGATYAIDADGKILHRHLGSTLLDDYEGAPDGGRPVSPSDLGVIELEAPVTLPAEILGRDAGTHTDAGTSPEETAPRPDAKAWRNPDAGMAIRPDGGVIALPAEVRHTMPAGPEKSAAPAQ
jgi:hypothetical protein